MISFRRHVPLTVWTFFSCLVTLTFLSTLRAWLPQQRKKESSLQNGSFLVASLWPFSSRQTLTCWMRRRAIICHYGDQESWRVTWFWLHPCQSWAFADRGVAGVCCAPHILEACSVKSSVCKHSVKLSTKLTLIKTNVRRVFISSHERFIPAHCQCSFCKNTMWTWAPSLPKTWALISLLDFSERYRDPRFNDSAPSGALGTASQYNLYPPKYAWSWEKRN